MERTRWRAMERFEALCDLNAERIRYEQILARPESHERAVHALWQAQVIGRMLFAALLTQQAE